MGSNTLSNRHPAAGNDKTLYQHVTYLMRWTRAISKHPVQRCCLDLVAALLGFTTWRKLA